MSRNDRTSIQQTTDSAWTITQDSIGYYSSSISLQGDTDYANSNEDNPRQRQPFSHFYDRRSTFKEWNKRQSPDDLAKAGFFYSGPDDHVQCFHCGIVLSQWEPDENPWVEHEKWNPYCQFLHISIPINLRKSGFKLLYIQESLEFTDGLVNEQVPRLGSTQIVLDADMNDLLDGVTDGEQFHLGSTQPVLNQDIYDYFCKYKIMHSM